MISNLFTIFQPEKVFSQMEPIFWIKDGFIRLVFVAPFTIDERHFFNPPFAKNERKVRG